MGQKFFVLGFVFSTCKYTSVFLNLMKHMKGIFNWNVKQLFLYLTAEYSTKNNVCVFLPLFQIILTKLLNRQFVRREISYKNSVYFAPLCKSMYCKFWFSFWGGPLQLIAPAERFKHGGCVMFWEHDNNY